MEVEVKDPLKQGLKPVVIEVENILNLLVEVKDPLKQGLKLTFTTLILRICKWLK